MVKLLVEEGLPCLEEFPSSFIANEVEGGPLFAIGGEGGIKGGTYSTYGGAELWGEVDNGNKERVMFPGGVGTCVVVEDSEKDEGGGRSILGTCKAPPEKLCGCLRIFGGDKDVIVGPNRFVPDLGGS